MYIVIFKKKYEDDWLFLFTKREPFLLLWGTYSIFSVWRTCTLTGITVLWSYMKDQQHRVWCLLYRVKICIHWTNFASLNYFLIEGLSEIDGKMLIKWLRFFKSLILISPSLMMYRALWPCMLIFVWERLKNYTYNVKHCSHCWYRLR